MSEVERYKVAYSLRFDAEWLTELGPFIAATNTEVVSTTVIGNEVHMLVRAFPEHEAELRVTFGPPQYESPKRVVKRTLVPIFATPAEEIEARKARYAAGSHRPTTAQR